MFRLIPPPLHRLALKIAHRVRHKWRLLRKVPISGVTVIASDAQGRVLLVRHSYGSGHWALPGGGIKRGEEPQDAAHREMREEVGCLIEQVELFESFEEVISGSRHTAYLVSARLQGELRPDMREVVEARVFEPASLPRPIGSLSRTRLERWQAQIGKDGS
ncbi:NUDIX domain-containing protein [Altererythrobacter sp.]|uniref:NUDIX domain-containing protein n=1 Tax=Altererythrobacter sp. TaxID=1872480 RepID=UPI003D044699